MHNEAGKIATLDNLIKACGRCVIVTHTHPDGDAVGSSLALQSYLQGCRGIDAPVVVPNSIPDTLAFLGAGMNYIDAEADPQKAASLIGGCDLLICLDFNAFKRTDQLEGALAACKAKKVLIDHHLNPDAASFDLCISRQDVSSACEVLYTVLSDMPDIAGNISALPYPCRFALMSGMTTDTNNFANSVFPGTLQMAGALLDSGVDRDSIIDSLYRQDRPERLKAFSDMLSSHLTILPGGIACIFMSSAMRKAYALKDGETEGLVNIPLNLAEVRMSIFARTEGDQVRISLRSKPGLSANAFAGLCFHGGGHELASGGKILIPEDIASENEAPAYIARAAARFLQMKGGGINQ